MEKIMVYIRWTGVSGLEITHNDQTILIDPYLSRIGKFKVFFRPLIPDREVIKKYLEGLSGELSAIIVGHTHYDHALDIPEISRYFDGPLIGSLSLERLMDMHGIPGRVCKCEGCERIELPGGAAVTMIPSMHGLVALGHVPYQGDIDPEVRLPLKAGAYRHGTVFMPKLEIDGKIFMHAGSANFIELELDGHYCDVLFMCIPGWKKNPEYTTLLLDILKPEVIVPFHFDDFSVPIPPSMKTPVLPLLDITKFQKRLSQSAPYAEIIMPQIFNTMSF